MVIERARSEFMSMVTNPTVFQMHQVVEIASYQDFFFGRHTSLPERNELRSAG